MAELGTKSKKHLFRFGIFELDQDNGELRKQGVRIQLQPKPLQMLEMLLERPNEIITREELRRRLWGGNIFVEYESGLNTAANRLRLKLGDSAESPRYIETVARTGYRFIAPVEKVEWDPTAMQAAEEIESPAITALPGRRKFPLWWVSLAAAALIAIAVISLLAARSPRETRMRFRQLTFHRGQVLGARFAPDGQSIVYAAQWDKEPRQMFLTSRASPESRLLGFPGMALASVSSAGELALLSASGTMNIGGGKLFRVPMNGSAPANVDQGIMTAEWSPDGRKLAVVRATKGQNQLEFPAGNVLYRNSGWLANVRFSPVSDEIAFIEHPIRHDERGQVRLIRPGGDGKVLGGEWVSISGLAWHPSSNEIWFTASRDEGPRSVWAVTRSGRLRPIAQAPGVLTIRDIARDGQMLLSRESRRLEMAGKAAATSAERDYSWLDWSRVQEVSANGSLILFDESGEAAGPHAIAYVRRTSDRGATRLGEGLAMALSPDGKWALVGSEDHKRLRLVPIEGGQTRNLPDTGLFYQWAKYFPDGKRLLVLASNPREGLRLYVQSLENSKIMGISPEMMVRNAAVSPDGDQVAVLSSDNQLLLFPAAGGEPKFIPTEEPLAPIRWSRDGSWILVQHLRSYAELPARISRIQVTTGRLVPWKDITPPDPMGVNSVTGVSITPDERSYMYSYRRVLSELYLCECGP